jgi:hypothetical protein
MQDGYGRPGDISACYAVLLAFLTVLTLPSKIIKSFRFRTRGRLSLGDALHQRLAQDLEDMAAEPEGFIQKEHTMVGQRYVTHHRHVAAADQPRIRDGMVGRATRAGGDQRRAVAGEPGNTVDARGLNGLGEGHRRQDGGESAGQLRLARPWGTKEEQVVPANRRHLQRSFDQSLALDRGETPRAGRPCELG